MGNLLGSTISLVIGDESGSFTLKVNVETVHEAPHDIVAEDLVGDGISDVITANGDSDSVAVFLRDQTGDLLSPTFFSTGAGPGP